MAYLTFTLSRIDNIQSHLNNDGSFFKALLTIPVFMHVRPLRSFPFILVLSRFEESQFGSLLFEWQRVLSLFCLPFDTVKMFPFDWILPLLFIEVSDRLYGGNIEVIALEGGQKLMKHPIRMIITNSMDNI